MVPRKQLGTEENQSRLFTLDSEDLLCIYESWLESQKALKIKQLDVEVSTPANDLQTGKLHSGQV